MVVNPQTQVRKRMDLGRWGLHRAAVFLGGQVEHEICFSGERLGQGAAPEFVQIRAAVHRQLGLHFQPVGG